MAQLPMRPAVRTGPYAAISQGGGTRRQGPLSPPLVLRLEGAFLLGLTLLLYAEFGGSWWSFAALFLVPDLGMIGYAAGPRIGAGAYNLTHTLTFPLALGAIALLGGYTGAIGVALIWAAHIGADRALGYGLKYPVHFRDTHLQRLG